MVGNASWCTFRLGGRLYGIRVERVQEVLKPMPLTPVPLAPAAVRGLLNLRGQIVTALDLAPSLDAIAADSSRCSHVVVRRGTGTFTLLVEAIGDVIRTSESQFEPCPETLRGPAKGMIDGVCKLERELLLCLDLDRALDLACA